jgi:hypothetical protein
MKFLNPLKIALGAAMLFSAVSHAGVLATFDNLPMPPAHDSASGLQYTNAFNSLDYQGISWDSHFSVVGDLYRVDPFGGPLFGIPHSGDYFVTNQDGQSGLMITTDQILTGAWFGRNQYYGYTEGGADQVSIFALSGSTELASVVFDLPENNAGQPEPLSFVDTRVFGALSGVTGYRIDRRMLGTSAGHWVADDFQFNNVRDLPEPGTLIMLGTSLAYLLARSRRQAIKRQGPARF